MENPIKMDDLGVPLSLETPISCHIMYHHPLIAITIIIISLHYYYLFL